MAKRLYNILNACNDEEEVKSEFAKFFKIKLVTHKYKIDLYTNNTLLSLSMTEISKAEQKELRS